MDKQMASRRNENDVRVGFDSFLKDICCWGGHDFEGP